MAARHLLAAHAFVALALCCAAGCLAPPAVMEAPPGLALEEALETYGPHAQAIELEVEPGRVLRGVFHAADAGAPVVLCLLEGTGSVAAKQRHYAPLCREFADLGFASLIVDYGGVGRSSGERSSARLADDARAMWDEAVRRAGGDPRRVVLRGVSLGTIATALLLDAGARPGGVELLLPVRPQTVVGRFADEFFSPFVGAFARLAYRDVARVYLEHVVAAVDVPLLVITAEDETLLAPDERALIEAATNEAGGTLLVRRGDHFLTTIESHALLSEELDFYLDRVPDGRDVERRARTAFDSLDEDLRARFPAGSPERTALAELAAYAFEADPLQLAAAALAGTDPVTAARLRWLFVGRPGPQRGLDALRASYDLSDPGGALPIDLIESVALPIDLAHRYGGLVFLLGPERIAWVARMRGAVSHWSSSVETGPVRVELDFDPARLARALSARGLRGVDLERQTARILLAAYRFPARLARTTDGALDPTALEILEKNGWRRLAVHDAPFTKAGLSIRANLTVQ